MALFALFGGFGEFDDWSIALHRGLLDRSSGDGSVCILPMHYTDDDFIAKREIGLYESLGARASVVPVRTREDAMQQANAQAVESCSVVFLHGGMFDWMVATLVDTPVWDAIVGALGRGASFAGTSGGAACLGHSVPSFSDEGRTVSWGPGLGLLPGGIVAVHWDNEEMRLMHAPFKQLPPDDLVLCVDERTVAVGDGNAWTTWGEGEVHVRNGGRESAARAGETFEASLGSSPQR